MATAGGEEKNDNWVQTRLGAVLPKGAEVRVAVLQNYSNHYPTADIKALLQQPWRLTNWLILRINPDFQFEEGDMGSLRIAWPQGIHRALIPSVVKNKRHNKTAVYMPESMTGLPPFSCLLISTFTEDLSDADLGTFTNVELVGVCNLCGIPGYPTAVALTDQTGPTAMFAILHHMLHVTIEDFRPGDPYPHRYVPWGPVAIGLVSTHIGLPRSDNRTLTEYLHADDNANMINHLLGTLYRDLAANNIDLYYDKVMELLDTMARNLGVPQKTPDTQRAAQLDPPSKAFDVGVVLHVLQQMRMNPTDYWLGGTEGARDVLSVLAIRRTVVTPVPPTRQTVLDQIDTALCSLSPVWWLQEYTRQQFFALPFHHMVAITIQGPIFLTRDNPNNEHAFSHRTMNRSQTDNTCVPDVREGRFLYWAYNENYHMDDTPAMHTLMWTLYKSYATIGLAGGDPIALLTSFTNPWREALDKRLQYPTGSADRVSHISQCDFSGMQGSALIARAYQATGGDEFYTLCGRGMTTIAPVRKFQRDCWVFTLVFLAAGEKRRKFVLLAWQRQFAMYHAFSTIGAACPSQELKIPTLSYNRDCKQGTENNARQHEPQPLYTAEQFAAAVCPYISVAFIQTLDSQAGPETDNMLLIEQRPLAVLDDDDGTVLPPTPLDFGDISRILPIEPPTGTDAENIANRRTYDYDEESQVILYYPPLSVVPRAWPSQPPSDAATKRRLASLNNQRDRDEKRKRPEKSPAQKAIPDSVFLKSPIASDDSHSDDTQDDNDDQNNDDQNNLTDNTHIINSIMQDIQQTPAPDTNAQALASIMGASTPPNEVVQFVRDAVPMWDTTNNSPTAAMFNKLVTLVDFNQVGERDCVVTWHGPDPSVGYRDPTYRGQAPLAFDSEWVFRMHVLTGWRRGKPTGNGTANFHRVWSSRTIPSGSAKTIQIAPADIAHPIPRLTVTGASAVATQIGLNNFFRRKATDDPLSAWRGNDTPRTRPGANPHRGASNTAPRPRVTKKRPLTIFDPPEDGLPPMEEIDPDESDVEPTNRWNLQYSASLRASTPPRRQLQLTTDERTVAERRLDAMVAPPAHANGNMRGFNDSVTGEYIEYAVDNDKMQHHDRNRTAHRLCNVGALSPASGMSLVSYSNTQFHTYLRKRACAVGGMSAELLQHIGNQRLFAALAKDKSLSLQLLNLDYSDTGSFDADNPLTWALFISPAAELEALKSASSRTNTSDGQLTTIAFLKTEQLALRYLFNVPMDSLENAELMQSLMFPQGTLQFYPTPFLLDTLWKRRETWSQSLHTTLFGAPAHEVMASFIAMAHDPTALDIPFSAYLLWQNNPTTPMTGPASTGKLGESKTARAQRLRAEALTNAKNTNANGKVTKATKAATTAAAAAAAATQVAVVTPTTVQGVTFQGSPAGKTICLNDLRYVLAPTVQRGCTSSTCPHQHISTAVKNIKFSRSTLVIPAAEKCKWAKDPATFADFKKLLAASTNKHLTP